MGNLTLNGATSGQLTLAPPAVAGTNTLTLPAQTATVLTDSSGVLNIGSGQVYKDASGNVGIGTTSPQKKFVVSNGGAVGMEWSPTDYTSNMRQLAYNRSTSAYVALRTEASQHEWYNGGTEAARIDSSGNLLVGTTSNTGSYRVNIKATDNNQLRLDNDGSTSTGMVYSNNGTGKVYSYWHNAQARYYITFSTGGVYIAEGATSWTSASDERVKDIIEPITDAASKVSSLRAVIGKYKTDEEGTRRSFLIAQDIQSVLPEAVDATDPNNLGVAYTDVIPLLVAAIKEQQSIIEDLKARLAVLEAK